MTYDFSAIEKKWQAYWDREESFRVENDSSRPKYYVLCNVSLSVWFGASMWGIVRVTRPGISRPVTRG